MRIEESFIYILCEYCDNRILRLPLDSINLNSQTWDILDDESELICKDCKESKK